MKIDGMTVIVTRAVGAATVALQSVCLDGEFKR